MAFASHKAPFGPSCAGSAPPKGVRNTWGGPAFVSHEHSNPVAGARTGSQMWAVDRLQARSEQSPLHINFITCTELLVPGPNVDALDALLGTHDALHSPLPWACGARLSPEHLSLLDAEHAKNEIVREDMAKEADERERRRVKRRGDGG